LDRGALGAADRAPQNGIKRVEQEKGEGTKKEVVVLVAEDNKTNQKLMLSILKRCGYIGEVAEDGNEAVDAVVKHGASYYTLILMDIMMPNCDGYEATRKIRSLPDEAAGRIPIIGVSAATAANVVENCLQCGMNDLIAKPYNVTVLKAYLADCVSTCSHT